MCSTRVRRVGSSGQGVARGRRLRRLLAGTLLLTSIAACTPDPSPNRPRTGHTPASATATNSPEWGVYAGPGAKGVRGAKVFARETSMPITRVLDFLPDDSWRAMTHADWLIAAHARSSYQLELSVPMLPRRGGATLERCASGEYNARWRTIAERLRRAGLESTVIRPGWEFNGDWYLWSAAGPGQAASYAGCFRELVKTMRAVSPGFTFNWSVNVGQNRLPAELGYPGNEYVDVISVDVYDYSSQWYPAPEGTSLDEARAKVWQTQRDGDHGLTYWSAFARAHGKPMGLSEWGLAWRADGHAGGDNTYFLDQMRTFLHDPATPVAFANYFNSADTSELKHNLLVRKTKFPEAARRFPELATPP